MAGKIIRPCAAVACILAWWWLGERGMAKGMGGLFSIFAAHAALVVAAILLARPVAVFIGDFFSGLYMPSGRHERLPPIYSVAEARMAAGDYEGARQAYAELAAQYPDEIAPRLRLMELHLNVDGDRESAELVRDEAVQSIKSEENRKKFARAAAFLLGETPP